MSIESIFPVPKLLNMQSIGLDISDRSVKYVSLKKTKNSVRINTYGRQEIPAGIVESGKIINKDALAEIIRSIVKKEKIPFTRVALPEEQIYLFTLSMPKVDPKEVATAIELSLEEHIPIAPHESVYDYDLIKEDKEGYHFSVIATPFAAINSYIELLEESGVTPLSFELEACSLARAVFPQGSTDTVMLVDLGATRTGISIVDSGSVVLTQTVEIGGYNVTKSLEKNLKIKEEEAEKLKREFGMNFHEGKESYLEAMAGVLSAIRDEINKVYIYWHTHAEEKQQNNKIKKIILCGGESLLKGFPEYISSSMGIPAELGNPWKNITDFSDYIPELSLEESVGYGTAIGLALGDFET